MRPLFAAVLVASCSPQHIDLGADIHPDAGPALDTLSLSGRFCAPPVDPNSFPVKVIFVVEQSGAMCILDPPGSQAAGSFCTDALAPVAGSLPPQPARVTAMTKMLQAFSTQPNTSVTLVPFEANVRGVWPMVSGQGQSTFESVTGAGLADSVTRLNQFQSGLGKGADYQGALQYAVDLVTADVTAMEAQDPATLANTRYVVVLVGSGMPFPRCAANDFLDAGDYASPANPELTWPDSSGAGCVIGDPDAGGCYCNTATPGDPDGITDFVPGTDRNQFSQLLALANQLKALQAAHHIGDVKLHSVQVFNDDVVVTCGLMCEDIAGTFDGVLPSQYAQTAQAIGEDLLTKLARATGGTVLKATDTASLAALSLAPLGFDSTASQWQEKTLMVRFLSSDPGTTRRVVDTDGDGLPDQSETATNADNADSDGDCFSDGFEVRHAADGFDPNVKDARGCDPASAATPNCTCDDTDGDGLSQFAEAYLQTNPTLADTDRDGLTDGDEVRWGLDPLVANNLDTDGDLVPDSSEILIGSDPTVSDPAYRTAWPVTYQVTSSGGADGSSVCFDFTVKGAALVPGANVLQVVTAVAPANSSASHPGVWRSACVLVAHDAGTEASATLTDDDFRDPSTMVGDPGLYRTECVTAQ